MTEHTHKTSYLLYGFKWFIGFTSSSQVDKPLSSTLSGLSTWLSHVNTRRVSYLCYTSCEYYYSLAVIPTVEHGLAVKLCYDGETMILAI